MLVRTRMYLSTFADCESATPTKKFKLGFLMREVDHKGEFPEKRIAH